ncbi:hypothetical protein [uncultured Senegalimassilia sp.]|uniref:hypothetical protein n=1 Tax=uncultured Senegalimassilia sp. TaxID=1714350 RepID=UPI0025FC6E02|nr:hypothetical protein [uncultured Senegalimassilia sp.]
MSAAIYERSDKTDSKRAVRDHKGRHYPSLAAMCRVWGVSRQDFLWRIRQGLSVEASLTAGRNAPRGGCPSRFHNANRRAA